MRTLGIKKLSMCVHLPIQELFPGTCKTWAAGGELAEVD